MKWYSNIFALLCQNSGTAAENGEGIETYTNGVWCEGFGVENCNGKKI